MRPEQAKMLRLLEQRVITGDKMEMTLFSKAPFSLWGGRVRMEQLFGREGLLKIVEELNTLIVA
jgi:type I restriction enzyme R subunit